MQIILGILIMILGALVCFPAKKEIPKLELKVYERDAEKETLIAHWLQLEPGVVPFDSGLGKLRIEFNKQS